MNSFIENLHRSFSKNSNNICLSIENENYYYKDVLSISEQIRHQLQNSQSQNIGIYLTDDVFMYAAILAIWLEGKTYVPIHPDFPLNFL